MELSRYIVRRVVLLIPVLLGLMTFVFVLIRLIPGDPAHAIAGMNATPQQIAAIRRTLNLNLPLYQQYGLFLWKTLHGNLGISAFSHANVLSLVLHAFPITVYLSFLGMIFAILVSVPVGTFSAYKHDSWPDHLLSGFQVAGISVPNFWLGLILLFVFAVQLRILPPGGYVPPRDGLFRSVASLLMPAVAIGFPPMGRMSRMVRATTLSVLNSDYVRTARGKGLSEFTVVVRHVLKNSIIPVLTLAGMETGYLLGGAVVIETIFFIPGMGRLLVTAVTTRDYMVIQGVILFAAFVFMVANLIVDVLYKWLNPKIQL